MKKIRKILISFMCIVFLISFTTSMNYSAQNIGKQQKIIRVAVPEQEGMFEIDEQGNYSGYSYDFLKRIAEITGWKYEFITYEGKSEDEAISTALDMVKKGEADLIGAMKKSSQLSKEYDYPKNNYATVFTTLSVLENNYTINETNFMNVNPLRIAVIEKSTEQINEMKQFLDNNNTKYQIIKCANHQEQYNNLKLGLADVVLGVSTDCHNDTRTIMSFSPRQLYFVTTSGNDEIVDQLDNAIEFIQTTLPFLQTQLYQKYFNDISNKFILTENERNFFKEKKVIKALIIPNSAPFAFLNSRGKPCGVIVSVLEDFAQKTGLNIEYDVYDKCKDFSTVLKEGKYDCILGIPVNESYNPALGIITSESLTTVDVVSFSKSAILSKSLSNCTVALVRASDIADKIESKRIIYCDDTKQCIKAVNSGKADIGFGNKSTVNYYIYDNFANLVVTPWIGYEQDIRISLSRDVGDIFISLLNKYIRSINQSDLTYYYSQANLIEDKNGFELFARSNPALAVALLSIFCFAIFATVVLIIVTAKNKKKNIALQRATSAKSEFLSNMSHDMRTPMNAIIGFSDFALANDTNLKNMREYMQEINSSSKYLLALINDVLDMSKMENSKMVLNYESVDTNEIIKQVTNIIEPSIKKKDIEFILEIPDFMKDNYLVIDKIRIEQVLVNILSNAVKFTPEGGKIEFLCENVNVGETKVSGEVIVRDTGIGMSKEFLPKLFLPFEQEYRDENKNYLGTGLGMSIVKNIIELMGGKIDVKSEINVGTQITIYLEVEIVKKAIKPNTSNTINNIKTLKGTNILIAEDHPVNLKIAIKLLENLGCKVEYAENGKIVTEKFLASNENYFDAILMDIRMPIMDGLQATKTIRSFKRSDAKTIPIIAMTANSFIDDIEKSKQYGMTEYLSKPINAQLLYKTLMDTINKVQ